MPFPLRVAGRRIATGQDLFQLVVADAKAGGGTVVSGRPPHQWVGDLIAAGSLDGDVAAALVAVMLNGTDAGVITEGARLAARVEHAMIRGMFPAAVDAQDVGLLLHADPFVANASVEDALLRAWAAVAPTAQDAIRKPLLERLRNAGLPDVETAVLVRHGTPDEIRGILPTVFIEGVPTGVPEALRGALDRDGDGKSAIAQVLGGLSKRARALIGAKSPQLFGLLGSAVPD